CQQLRSIMWQYVSLCRDREGLLEGTRRIRELKQLISTTQASILQWAETSNMLQVAELVIAAALQRRESRGSHWRLDYPQLAETLSYSHYVLARTILPETLNTSPEEVIVYA